MTAAPNPKLALRPYLPADAPVLATIFRTSIEELTGDDYNEAQQGVWAAVADDEKAFTARLAGALTIVATLGGPVVGFASLKGNDTVDLLYVHPAAAGQGAGSILLDALEKLAAARGASKLAADASDNARAFFEHRGFAPQSRNTVLLGDEWLPTTTMEKKLTAKGSAP